MVHTKVGIQTIGGQTPADLSVYHLPFGNNTFIFTTPADQHKRFIEILVGVGPAGRYRYRYGIGGSVDLTSKADAVAGFAREATREGDHMHKP